MPTSTIVITGGNSGLGLECARSLAKNNNWQVVLAVRDTKRGEEAAAGIRASVSGAAVTVLPLDLASPASIRSFPNHLANANLPPLHSLICNAGLQEIGTPTRTVDGYESTFAVNHLGHFLLTHLLLHQLVGPARIVFVSSGTHDPRMKTGMPWPRYTTARELAFDETPGAEAGRRRYTNSKLCNVLCTYEFVRRLKAADNPALQAVRVDAFDPGMMPGTGLARDYKPLARFMWRFILPALIPFISNVNTVRKSADRLAALAIDPSAATGRYISEGRPIESSVDSYDERKALDLWKTSIDLVHLTATDSPLLDQNLALH